MTERLTDEALMNEAADLLAAEYRANGFDSYGDLSEQQRGAFTLCSIRVIARALSRRATPPASRADADLRAAVEKHLTWFERFICDQHELDSSTPRKVAQNAQEAAQDLRAALSAPRPDEGDGADG